MVTAERLLEDGGRRRFGGEHGYGYIPDPKRHRVTSARHKVGASPAPPEASIRETALPILNQAKTSACTGFATSAAINDTFAAAGSPFPAFDSVLLYKGGRLADLADPSLDLVDEGAEPNQVIRYAADFGLEFAAGSMAERMVSGEGLQETINEKPDFENIVSQRGFRFVGATKITGIGSELVETMKRAVASKFGMVGAIAVDTHFEEYDDGVLSAPIGHIFGSHMVRFVSYETFGSRTYFTIANSWGVRWGLDGYAVVDESWLHSLRDVYVMSVTRAE